MNISPIAEKTTSVKTDNKELQVADLPKSIRYEVETLDRLHQQLLDSMGQVEILELAIIAQKMKIAELIKESTKLHKIENLSFGDRHE